MIPAPDSASVLHVSTTTSTQDLAHAEAARGAPHGWMVVADEQTEGRGSRGRTWQAQRGGAWVSVVLRPESAEGVALLSLRVGLVVAETLGRWMETGSIVPQLRWPNDLMVGSRKLGGVLCEARWQGNHPAWVVAGIGVNVHNGVPGPVDPPAARLADLASDVPPGPDVALSLGRVVASVDTATGSLGAEEHARFDARDWRRGQDVELGPGIHGRADGVSPDGRLRVLVTASDGTERVSLLTTPEGACP